MDDITRFSSGVEGEIMRDVLRTFQNECFFQEGHLGRSMLCRVLVAVSKAADASVGYCQGMNFVVGVFLHSCCFGCLTVRNSNIRDQGVSEKSTDAYAFAAVEAELRENKGLQLQIESLIFDIMLALIEKNGKISMVGLWGEKIPRLKLRVYQLDRLLRWFCPHLQAHFAAIDLSPEVLTAQWFITLFSYTLSPWDTMRIWDYVFLGGWEALFRVAVSLLSGVETQLLSVGDMEGVSLLLKQWRSHKRGLLLDTGSIDGVFERVCKQVQHVTDEVLLKLSEAFAQEVLLLGHMRGMELNLFSNNNSPADSDIGAENSNGDDSTVRKNSENADVISSKNSNKPYSNNNTQSANDNKEFSNSNITPKENSNVVKPVYWLQRYAYKLTPQMCLELSQLSQTIARLDAQIDTDKQLLTQKILVACETHDTLAQQRQSVSRCVATLRHRLDRVSRRMQRATQRAQVVTRCASEVFFMLQQVQLLEAELKRAQASGKNISLSDATHDNNINISANTNKRSRFFERLFNRVHNTVLNDTAVESISHLNSAQGVSDSRTSRASVGHNNSRFVFGGSRSHHKHSHHHGGHHKNNKHRDESHSDTGNGNGVSRRQRLASLLIPSPSRDTHGEKTRHSSDKTENISFQDSRNSFHFHFQSLQSLTSSLSDLLSPNASDNTIATNKTNRNSIGSSKSYTSGSYNDKDDVIKSGFRGWMSPTHLASSLTSSISQMYSNNANNSNNLGNSTLFQSLFVNGEQGVSRQAFDAEDLHYMDNTTATTQCDSAQNNYNFALELQLQPPLTEEECVLVGDLDRDSCVNRHSETHVSQSDILGTDTSKTELVLEDTNNSDKEIVALETIDKTETAIDDLLANITDKEPTEQVQYAS